MQTHFSIAQLANPKIKEADEILRKCVHCGLCAASCPTYTLLGDELDSPRGRIYQIKDMLENDKKATSPLVKHIDRCLSCLGCMSSCPSGVNYMNLVDHARLYIEKTYKRPIGERMLRSLLKGLLPNSGLLRFALWGARLLRPIANLMPGRLKGMVTMVPRRIPRKSKMDSPQKFFTENNPKYRVVLMNGCAQKILSPSINEATINLLRKMETEVIIPEATGCCGALVHHMGDEDKSHQQAKANIIAWINEMDSRKGLDAIIINTSGCGTIVKNYGHMFKHDSDMCEKAARVSAIAKDITEFVIDKGLPEVTTPQKMKVAYHSACSMQYGQKITEPPKILLKEAGFDVLIPPEGHLCCGSAGTYNILQPELSAKLLARKVSAILSVSPDVISTANIGCITQIASGMEIPIVHTVELLDWATGGEKPNTINNI